MSKRQIIILLGAVIILLPFLGFTSLWDTILNVVIGLTIITIAYRLYPQALDSETVADYSDKKELSGNQGDFEVKKSDLPFVDYHNGISTTPLTNDNQLTK